MNEDSPGHAPSGAPPSRIRIVGAGRAGGAFARALADAGWRVLGPAGRNDDLARGALGVDVVLLATPDRMIAEVAAAIEPDPRCLVLHCAGSFGLEVLGHHPRRGALHPLVSLPDAETGAARLGDGAWFALCADHVDDLELLRAVVADLGGHAVEVADADRAVYHAAAAVASNHLVALFGQVERLVHATGVPLEAFVTLADQTLEGIAERGPAAALTGPIARADWTTVARHLRVLDEAERPGYAALAELAARLVPGSDPPAWVERARRDGMAPDTEGIHE